MSDRTCEFLPSDAGLLWHVICVEPRREQAVADELTGNGVRCYLPTVTVTVRTGHGRRPRESVRPLLPGYLLLGLGIPYIDPRYDGWPMVRSVDYVRGVLGTADGYPLRVPWSEIEAIQVGEDMGQFDEPIILEIGEHVRILTGPFAEHVGPVDRVVGKWVSMMAGKVRVTVSARDVERTDV